MTPEEKLKWIFNVFDKDESGMIDPKELSNVVVALFLMVGIRIHEDILEDKLYEVMEAVDVDGDGEIAMEEFIENALQCDFIQDIVNGDIVNGIIQL